MTKPPLAVVTSPTPATFAALVQEIRPELHHYCAHMIGSAIDAEDVVQEALTKAYAASNLHRGRSRLRELAAAVQADAPTELDRQEQELLVQYIDRFNARDFDTVRAMLAHEVRLDLFNRTTRHGLAAVGDYFQRYEQVGDWQLALGSVENRPAILVSDPRIGSTQPVYFMLLTWDTAQVLHIRDYRYVPYVMRTVEQNYIFKQR